jgi:hypothetical protein
MTLTLLLLVGCHGLPFARDHGSTDSADTGVPQSLCGDGSCVDDVASALIPAGQTFLPVVVAPEPGIALIGVRAQYGTEFYYSAEVAVVSLDDDSILATWTGGGNAIAASKADPGEFAVTGGEFGGVSVIDGYGSGPENVGSAVQNVEDRENLGLFGFAIALTPLETDETTDLAVLDPGSDHEGNGYAPGGIWVFDLPLGAAATPDDASRRLVAAPWYASAMIAWDADGDGIDDLVVDEQGSLASYPSPWTGDLTPADAAVRWTGGSDGAAFLDGVGDLDGDGLADLCFSSYTFPEENRRGTAWIVSGGDAVGGPLADAPLTVTGDVDEMALGTGASAGDLDGDGDPELLIGAAGLGADLGGLVLAFDGTATGALTPADAVGRLHGDFPRDHLGGAVLAVDPDGDGSSDVIACELEAGCFAIPGSALAP